MNFKYNDIKSLLKKTYTPNSNEWRELLRTMFKRVELFERPTQLFENQDNVLRGGQFGIIKLEDGKNIALFEVEVADSVRIAKNRVALREIAVNYIDQNIVHGALVFYFNKNQESYRLSFMARQSELTDEGVVTTQTQPKRFTYLLGSNEPCSTAAKRIEKLIADNINGFISIKTVIDAFSVEKLSKDFFKEYKEIHYNKFIIFLTGEDHKGKTINELENNYLENIFKNNKKDAREFVKKLLGRIIFMYFVQKKGWLGSPTVPSSFGGSREEAWKDGNLQFMNDFFEKCSDKNHFHSRFLSRLFHEALNTDRRADNDYFELTDSRVPFLNGGLFEEERKYPEAKTIDFPSDFFKDLLAFFNQYNFTIDENSPEEQEVGIDPEMLGHIFENLLEDNKDKGAFYTPKEIVHYMCQESLIQYLNVGEVLNLADVTLADVQTLIRDKTVSVNLQNKHNALKINTLLKNVKICDPAIGSGAFPIGLLQEIFKAQQLLYPFAEPNKSFDPAKVKKDIIQNAIYGVDLDGGAVEIARLRFWLALVVDENVPQPLPNLDYKIMQGNSLLEQYAGIDLKFEKVQYQIKTYEPPTKQTDLFGTILNPQITFTEFLQTNEDSEEFDISELEHTFFYSDNPEEKRQIRQKLETFERNFIQKRLDIALEKIELRLAKAARDKEQFEKDYADKANKVTDTSKVSVTYASKIAKLEKVLAQAEAEKTTNRQALSDIQNMESDQKPYFLWHLYFKNVFDEKGGFDIVIGNPPYVQLQKMKNSEIYENSKFETYSKSGDIYCLFYEKGFSILSNKGILCYITSNSWLKTKYGELLRTYFSNKSNPKILINFENTQIFNSATVEVNILLSENNNHFKELEVTNIGTDFKNIQINNYIEKNKIFITSLDNNGWVFGDKSSIEIKKLMENNGIPLKNFDIDIYIGILNGFNDAYIINSEVRTKIIGRNNKSNEIIKPILRGKDLKRYTYNWSDTWLINTHNGIKKQSLSRVNVEQDFIDIYEHLLPYKEQLEIRQNKGEHWTNLRNCGYFLEFDKPKIIWGELSDSPKFVYDESGFYAEATLFAMIGNNLKYLLGILNSKIALWYFNQITTTSGVGTSRWKKYKIEQIPIPEVPESEHIFIQLVDYQLFLHNKNKNQHLENAKTIAAYFDDIINGCVFELYFKDHVTERGITIIDDVRKVVESINAGSVETETETDAEIANRIYATYTQLRNSPAHEKMQLFAVRSPDVLLPILRS